MKVTTLGIDLAKKNHTKVRMYGCNLYLRVSMN